MEMPIHHPSSAEMVVTIDDLLITILTRLPIKSLLQFKLVSKGWLCLISDPVFCHLRNSIPSPAVGLFLPLPSANAGEDNLRYKHEYVPFRAADSDNFLPFSNQISGIRILQSCKGLMLCCSRIAEYAADVSYFVFNPTTGKTSTIPEIAETNGNRGRICGMNLAFDPAKSWHYSVVNVRLLDQNSEYQIELYSSETGSWQVSGEPFSSPADFEKGVHCNGAIHWICTFENKESLYFNVENQKLGIMPTMPLNYSIHCKRHYYLGESSDHLHLIDMRGPLIKLNIYCLKRDYSEWFVKYKVDVSAVVVANPCMVLRRGNLMFWCDFVFSVIGLVGGEKEEDSFLVLQIPGKVVRFNIVRNCFDDLMEFESDHRSLKYPNVAGFQYVQSISCV